MSGNDSSIDPRARAIHDGARSAGIYVHLPFCVVRCTYCDFYTLAGGDALAGAYVDAVAKEIEEFPEREQFRPAVASVYVGGGTPSHLPAGSVRRVLEAIRLAFDIEPDAEITVEANPESAEAGKLREFRTAGANRLSMGVQSFQPELLKMMGRPHGPDEPARAVAAAREARFENVSVDLIYGLPGQDVRAWAEDLDRAIGLGVEHLSAYLLETDKDTPLARSLAAGFMEEPDAAAIEALFAVTEDRLPEAGFVRYEISNWARPGRASRHNLAYWGDLPYVGFGASAHSYFKGVRSACRLSAPGYIEAIRKGEASRLALDDGSEEIRLSEAIVTALRLAAGADFDAIGARYGVDLWERHARDLDALARKGWIRIAGPRVSLTVQGILWSMDALAPFVAGDREGHTERATVPSESTLTS